MSDIRVLLDNRLENVRCVLENRRSMQSSGDVSEQRKHSMDLESVSTNPRPRKRCLSGSKCTVISVAVIAVIGGFIGGVLYNSHFGTSEREETIHSSQVSSQTGNSEISIDGVDLRINAKESVCDEPSCSLCKTEVQAPDRVPGEPEHCSSPDRNVKNASCYLCGGKCSYNLTTLLAIFGEGDGRIHGCGGRPREVTCCLITQMGNLGNYCGANAQFNCYNVVKDGEKVAQPMCKCPIGKTGDRCQDLNMEMLNCRCYKTAYKFCGQESMEACDSKDRGLNITQCHMIADRSGVQHNCLCNNKDDVDNLDSCSVPHTDAQTNESSKLFGNFSLLILSLAIVILDKR